MTVKEYFNRTRPTILYCIKICGLIFTVIAVIISIAISFKSGETENPIFIFLTCFVFGNLLGIFIAGLAFYSGFLNAKKVFKIYNSIPSDLRSNLGLYLRKIFEDNRYHFLEFEILGSKKNSPLRLSANIQQKEVWLTVPITVLNYDIDKQINIINKQYKKQKIFMTAFGLVKAYNFKKWASMDKNEILADIEYLYFIAKTGEANTSD